MAESKELAGQGVRAESYKEVLAAGRQANKDMEAALTRGSRDKK